MTIQQRKPNPIQRARAAIDFYRHGWKRFMPYFHNEPQQPSRRTMAVLNYPIEGKVAPFIWPDWRLGTPQWRIVNYEAYAQEGFSENAIVYGAIMYKVRAITLAPLLAYTGTIEEPELLPADHPLQKLVMRPNRYMSWSEFQGIAEMYLNLSGNNFVYVYKEDENQTTPDALYLLRPDRVLIVPHPQRDRFIREGRRKEIDELIGYIYVPEGKGRDDGIPFLPQNIIHTKLPNPLDPLDGLGYGLSPLSPGARSADVDNQFTRYLKLFVDKGAIPPGLLKYDVPIGDGDAARAREQFMSIYGGVDNWTKVAVLDQGGEYQRLALNFDEMGFEEIDGRNESRIVAPFGVPLTLIETRPQLVQSTYSNKETDRVMFWQDTMVPELRWFEVDYQYYLQGDMGEFVAFDFSKVPALMPSADERAQRANDAFKSGGITRNEYRATIGFDPAEDGNVYLIPFNVQVIPARDFGAEMGTEEEETQEGMPEAVEQAEEETAALPPPEESKALTDEQKANLWKQADRAARAWEEPYGEAANRAFEKDKRAILALVSEAKAKALQEKATVAWTAVWLAVQNYLRNQATGNWQTQFSPVMGSFVVAHATQLNETFNMEYNPRELLAQQWFNEYVMTFAQPINETTERAMSVMFQQAMAEGWSIEEMSNNLETMFEQWMEGDLTAEDFEWYQERMPFFRRELISRTETIRTANFSSTQLYRAWGVEQREWISTLDGRTRPDHAEANGQIVGINETFTVGGASLRFPGDPAAPIEQTANCRCSTVPVIP